MEMSHTGNGALPLPISAMVRQYATENGLDPAIVPSLPLMPYRTPSPAPAPIARFALRPQDELLELGTQNDAHPDLDAQPPIHTNDEHLNQNEHLNNPTPILPRSAKCLADVEAEELTWLIEPYLLEGKLTGLEGDPGVGKTWVGCAFATMVSTGKPMEGAEGFKVSEQGNVLFCTGEDGLGDTLRPRMEGMGAELKRIYAYDEPLVLDEAGVLKLENEIVACEAKLVVVDPLVAFMGGKVDAYRANEMRAMLRPLADLAKKHKCAIVLIRHLTKAATAKAVHRGQGSIDVAAACRAVMLVGADPNDRTRRAVTLTKMNLAADTHSAGFTIENGAFKWTGHSNLTPSSLLAAEGTEETISALEEAKKFLKEMLAEGPMPSSQVKAAAKEQDITLATLRRAQDEIKVKSVAVREHGKRGVQEWEWQLPAEDANGEEPKI